jgi:aryl-alcohol dehydrogenase-like predicted oxidoreductase
VLPIPGTGSPDHLRENVKATLIKLSADDLLALEEATGQPN